MGGEHDARMQSTREVRGVVPGFDREPPGDTRTPVAIANGGSRRPVTMIAGLFGLALLSLPDSPLATDYKATRPLSVSNPSAVNIGPGLSSNQQLNANQYLLSNNGQYELDMLPNGVGVLWANLPGTSPCPMWTFPPTTYNLFSNDAWTLMATPSPGDYLIMQDDGNFVQYPAPGEAAIWASDTANNSGATLSLQDDGNLVIYLGSTAIWSTSTNDYRGPVLCKGNSLEANQGLVQSAYMYNPVAVGDTNTVGACRLLVTTSGSLELLSAGPPNTLAQGAAGSYLIMQADGNLVFYRPAPPRRSGPLRRTETRVRWP